MISAEEIFALQDRLTIAWHAIPDARSETAPGGPPADAGDREKAAGNWLGQVARQHRANFNLWHIEDEARAPDATDAEVAQVKFRVDKTNQLRNDLAEGLDRTLLGWLESRGLPNLAAPLHSESPGLIVDRLSILALKIYHTREEAERADAPQGHAERNRRAPGNIRRAARRPGGLP